MIISGLLGRRKEFPWNISGLGPRWIISMEQETYSADWSVVPNFRGSYGSIRERACEGNTGQHYRTMSNTTIMAF